MYCQSCGVKLADNVNFCPHCGEKLQTGSTAVSRLIHYTFKCEYFDEHDAALTITNKRVTVKWGNELRDTPLNHISGVHLKKTGFWGDKGELSIAGVGQLKFARYAQAARAADLIRSLIMR